MSVRRWHRNSLRIADGHGAADFENRLRAGGLKKALFEYYWNFFAPYRAKRAELAANLDYVDKVLRKGAARAVAAKTMARARQHCGLR